MSGVRFMQRWAVVERPPAGPVRVVSGHWTRSSAIRGLRWLVEHPDRSVLRRSWAVSVVPTHWAPTSRLAATLTHHLSVNQGLTLTALTDRTALPADVVERVLLGLSRTGWVVHRSADPERGLVEGTWRLTTFSEQRAAADRRVRR